MSTRSLNEKGKIGFWIFGILQSISLGSIIFLIFKSLSTIAGFRVVGLDTQILLSILFPVFLLIVEYIIYSKIGGRKC